MYKEIILHNDGILHQILETVTDRFRRMLSFKGQAQTHIEIGKHELINGFGSIWKYLCSKLDASGSESRTVPKK